jgi:hypothetical protein
MFVAGHVSSPGPIRLVFRVVVIATIGILIAIPGAWATAPTA